MVDLIKLYREMSDLALAVCKTCSPPYKCCEVAGCNQARFWAKWLYDVTLEETNGPLPYLTDTGCTVAPHHRPLCAMFVCGDKLDQLPQRYFDLREQIAKLEAGKFKS